MAENERSVSVIPALFYDDANTALEWLETAFGFEPRLLVTDDKGKVQHAEMSCGNGRVMVGPAGWSDWAKSPRAIGGICSGNVHVYIENVNAHCEHARAAGADIVMEPEDQFYGDRAYRARDPEGHIWSFSEHIREVTPAEMEAATGLTVAYR